MREIVEVAAWCTTDDPTALLSDRIRLLDVRLGIGPAGLALLEAELPVLTGAAPGLSTTARP